jgi:hypothetical protein
VTKLGNRILLTDKEVQSLLLFIPVSLKTRSLRAKLSDCLKTRTEKAAAAGRKLGRPSTCTVTREQVLIARKEGLTWVQVGEQLGISTTKACDLGRAA